MFTGIVEELGEISGRRQSKDSIALLIKGKKIMPGLQEGDSIAVNGVCLTVARISTNVCYADVMPETLRKTNLNDLKSGDKVNLERALPTEGRLGGHFVSGHIDATGEIVAQKKEGNAWLQKISAPAAVMGYLIPKGSIAVDGISLTIVELEDSCFSVSLIPHTARLTTLGFKKSGDKVNLEVDLLGKYVQKFCAEFFKDKNLQPALQFPEQAGAAESGRTAGEGLTYSLLSKKGYL